MSGSEVELGAFGELLEDPLASDAYEQLLDHSEIEQVRALLGSLNEREREILRSRYGLDGPERSLREVGDRLGLSGERVRQIEERALGKLRSATSWTRPGTGPDPRSLSGASTRLGLMQEGLTIRASRSIAIGVSEFAEVTSCMQPILISRAR